jgi:dGTPase
VFISPENAHHKNRLTHTIQVARISRTVCRALGLNEDLAEAIAQGHDLGHTPFGHVGERALSDLYGHFAHNEQSVRLAEKIDKLNLTEQVLDGILHHSGDLTAKTLEGKIIKYADRIAYINHDIEDAVREGVLDRATLPREPIAALG